MAELADALDLGSSAFGRGGSSPPSRTVKIQVRRVSPDLYFFFGGWPSAVPRPMSFRILGDVVAAWAVCGPVYTQ